MRETTAQIVISLRQPEAQDFDEVIWATQSFVRDLEGKGFTIEGSTIQLTEYTARQRLVDPRGLGQLSHEGVQVATSVDPEGSA